MGDVVTRKKSFGFLNPFRSKGGASRSSSKATSISDLSIEELKVPVDSKTTSNKLRKKSSPAVPTRTANKNSIQQSRQPRHASFPAISIADEWERDEQTGERKDHTDLLHSLAHRESDESLAERTEMLHRDKAHVPGSEVLSRLPSHAWKQVVESLPLADVASLALSCKAFLHLLGPSTWTALNDVSNVSAKIDFLRRLDKDLPDHLLCFPCAIYHVRTQKGNEILRPTNIANPLFNCPNAFNPEKRISRTRLTVGRSLPLPFAQLVLRAHRYSADHGVAIDSMARRYKDRDGEWTHQTRFAVVNNHLLVRVISSAFAAPALPPAGLRRLLYSHNDNFNPYFSVCAHWRDGNLMPAVKCALSHIPKPPDSGGVVGVAERVKLHLHPQNPLITLCSECRPIRRCPECPSEYLIELRMQEDKSDPSKLFKHAIVVTRWSDLGDGSSPQSPEWAACNGDGTFDSFTALGRRAISGVFESQFTVDQIPGQNIVSMNPSKEKRGEAGHDWY
ncbi:hypothetical protein PV08_00150 [Exophiala spinifera]|uniref:F-box domain-containing protein n=1 Tax=Exophiala spinifera TaxID=91928 RepID=A0A0D2A402_9EURO|nr:uncharacterized protein PV08_00150 [Exophiala spinifera]KIW19577.1 hypothetical protein PV08_00150 [Exophiala spinifera]